MSIHIDAQGKIALITGASGKLGGTMAKTLAAAGADIALHYFHNFDAAQAVANEIKNMGRRCTLVQGPVADQSSVQSIKAQIEEALGAVDILVLNAVSQIHPWRNLLDESEERVRDQFESCSLQTLHMCQAFVPTMCANSWGRVIGISTECIMQLYPTQSAYVAAKRGMDGMLRILANEVGEHEVTVNQVAPGWINSDNSDDQNEGAQGYIKKNSKMGRRASDQDVANSVAFLASDLARSVTGQWISVSCGSASPRV